MPAIHRLRLQQAAQPAHSDRVWQILANSVSDHVRLTLAENPATPGWVLHLTPRYQPRLRSLEQSLIAAKIRSALEEKDIRLAIARHPAAPRDTLQALLDDHPFRSPEPTQS